MFVSPLMFTDRFGRKFFWLAKGMFWYEDSEGSFDPQYLTDDYGQLVRVYNRSTEADLFFMKAAGSA